MSLPFRLEDSFKSETALYTYKELCYLVAWGLVAEDVRLKTSPDKFIESHPDVWEHKLIEADKLIRYTEFKELNFT